MGNVEKVSGVFIPAVIGEEFKTKNGDRRTKIVGLFETALKKVGRELFLTPEQADDFRRAHTPSGDAVDAGYASVVIESELRPRDDGSTASVIVSFKRGPTFDLAPRKAK